MLEKKQYILRRSGDYSGQRQNKLPHGDIQLLILLLISWVRRDQAGPLLQFTLWCN